MLKRRIFTYVGFVVALAVIAVTFAPVISTSISSSRALAQGEEEHGILRARVMEAGPSQSGSVPGTTIRNTVQSIKAEIISGERKGETVVFENDFIQLEDGDVFYMNYIIPAEGNGEVIYSVRDADRRFSMIAIIVLFAAVVLVFGGKQGLRSLLSLAGSLFVIVYVLVPTLVKGISPIPVAILVASAVLFFAIFFTHGFNRRSLVAFLGTVIAVALTGLLATLSIEWANLTGFSTDESVYLNLNTGGRLDMVGLLLAGIIIGALGVLDDIAVTQAAVVRELYLADPNLGRREVYMKAIRVGKEHVGALVNTLVLAYTGSALPLLLLFSVSGSGAMDVMNMEIFATEIVRSLIGSIGLVLAVPITTYLAALMLRSKNENGESSGHTEIPGHTHTH